MSINPSYSASPMPPNGHESRVHDENILGWKETRQRALADGAQIERARIVAIIEQLPERVDRSRALEAIRLEQGTNNG